MATKTFKKVTMEGSPHDLITYGYTLAINDAHTWTKEVLVAKINRKVDHLNGTTPVNTNVNSNKSAKTTRAINNSQPKIMASTIVGDIAMIFGKPEKDGTMILKGRRMKVISREGSNIIGHLVKESDGSLQRSKIVMPIIYTNYKIGKAQ